MIQAITRNFSAWHSHKILSFFNTITVIFFYSDSSDLFTIGPKIFIALAAQ